MAKDPITGEPLAEPKRKRTTSAELKIATKRATKSAEAPPPAKATPLKKFEPPKNLALCADMYYQKREQRLALERQAKLLQEEESACREHIIQNLPKSQASGIAGKICRVAVENKDIYSVKDWDSVWGYIIKNVKKMPGLTGMLQRRINESMVKEMVEAGTKIPGVEKLEVPVLRVNKL